ncbi:GGDEF domain-containing protein [Rhodovulum iodosum]|nr:GGDEF domain-containing protein [Rhodovulum robiginosum]
MPMHLWLNPAGRIVHAGRKVRKLGGGALAGRPMEEVLEVRKPRPVRSLAELLLLDGQRLEVRLTAAPDLRFKGQAVSLPAGGGAVLDLSLGLSVVEAVSRFDLTLQDFAPTDLAVEMLYLVEAKTAVMEEYKRLNRRLNGARIDAEERAVTDTLTGLRNRRAMDGALAQMVAAARPFGLMHLDLDHFKQVNDSLGHAAGDHVLQEVGRILLEETRTADTVSRVGGDEFLVLFDGLADAARLTAIARRIIARLERPMPFDGTLCRVSASIGATLSIFYDRPDAERVLRDADAALYASKHKGRAEVSLARGGN